MNRLAILFGLLLIGLVGGCMSMNSPAESARIVAANDGITHVRWTYVSSVRNRSALERNRHLNRHEARVPLPVFIQAAEPGEYLWIAPVCEGATNWRKARAYQLHPGVMTAKVSC